VKCEVFRFLGLSVTRIHEKNRNFPTPLFSKVWCTASTTLEKEQSDTFTTYFSVSGSSSLRLKDSKTVTYQHPTSEYWGKAYCQSSISCFP